MNLSFVSPGLHLNILETEKMLHRARYVISAQEVNLVNDAPTVIEITLPSGTIELSLSFVSSLLSCPPLFTFFFNLFLPSLFLGSLFFFFFFFLNTTGGKISNEKSRFSRFLSTFKSVYNGVVCLIKHGFHDHRSSRA